ncbi:hypothetical protein ACFSTE_12080 [Aquimarina hainanensis]|uniref:Transmembrane protein n=1 Tax=Aquimarina hainanensis TaxID=1578017 RepID=A0ABW5N8N0_9FLAO|nr:hypothetical protein [Aquimarina sp. TRL1]QKX05231.1 hypothetical protein HN014_09970 [Aquimarina sp. TRL1]
MEKIRLDPSKKVIIPKLPKRKWVDDPEMKLCISLMPDFFNDQIIKNDSTLEDEVVVTDNYFLRTSKNNMSEIIIGGVISLIGIFIMSLMEFNIGGVVIGSCFIFFGGLLIVLFLTKKDKEFILDRDQGLMQYPNSWWYPSIVTSFNDARIVLLNEGKYQYPVLKALTKGFLAFPYRIVDFHPLNFWSFMVWYMDKNRPLPPGDAFDPYRQRDYERRKAAGFPKPLYPSEISTPEATPEQQAERERIGGW